MLFDLVKIAHAMIPKTKRFFILRVHFSVVLRVLCGECILNFLI